MSECIALIRGINVGRGKRVSMSDLRQLVSDLGHTNVRTLLNSGNVLFQSPRSFRARGQKEEWSPDALAITSRAAYLWCSAGVLDSKVSQAFARNAGAGLTTRNWGTVLKLQAAVQGRQGA
jgi:uncharacterized protein (DUF1697 family)